jgi:hypothetical protein
VRSGLHRRRRTRTWMLPVIAKARVLSQPELIRSQPAG